MSEPIKVGDLVMILRTHCGTNANGTIGTVLDIRLPMTGFCASCLKEMTACAADLEVSGDKVGWNPLQWLKRIPPLADLEGEKDAADVNAALGNINRKMREFLDS